MMVALTTQIVGGEEDNAKSVQDVFAQSREAEVGTAESLVGQGWKRVEPERVMAVVHSNETHGNRQVD